ncbi:MAG: lyase family protein [bacterium]
MNKSLIKDIKAVLFDVDNTLIASNEFVFHNIKETINRWQNMGHNLVSVADEEITRILAKNLPFEDIFKSLFPNDWEGILANYREHAVNQPYRATVGAIKAVQDIKMHGMVIGLVTNRVRMLEERLGQAGFNTENFEFMCMPPSKEYGKPHPRAFEDALNRLKIKGIDNSQVLVFGDHTDDYYSATYNQLKFIAVLQGYTSRGEFIDVGLEDSLIIDDLQNIELALKKIIDVNIYQQSLQQTSALDGRHAVITNNLRHYFSEYALHKYRIKVEIEHLISLSEYFNGQVVRTLSEDDKKSLRDLYLNFSQRQSYEVLQYDHLSRNGIGPTEHDVKSCELWIVEKLQGISLENLIPCVHMFVTSEDINNLAYKSMLAEAVNDVFVPAVYNITDRLDELAKQYLSDPLMGRTHVQPASPTTFGKVFANYLSRLVDGLTCLKNIKLKGKVNGAVGNYNAFVAAYPDLDWQSYSRIMCDHLGFDVDLWTDQRGPHSDMARAFQAIQEIGNVVRDLSTDLSLYAAFGTMYFSKVETHVGSSVMPHKINPWFAEVAEGNIKKANFLINCFVNEMDVSRLQRDLSDHDYERSYGEAVGYVLVAIEHLRIALDLIRPDIEYSKKELRNNPQVVTEAIQTVLRKHGQSQAYNILKDKFRGSKPTLEDMNNFVDSLEVDQIVKQEIKLNLDPEKYTGLAVDLSRKAIEKYRFFRSCVITDYLKID